MAIIYTYPSVTPTDSDLILISDVSETGKPTRSCTISSLVALVGALVPGSGTVTSIATSNSTFINVTATPSPITTTGSLTATLSAGGTPGVTTFLRGDNSWQVPVGTTYTAGDGLDLTGTVFSTDLRLNGGLVINGGELQVDVGASDLTGVLVVDDGGTGAIVFEDGGVMIGNGSNNLEATDALLNGELVIGSTGVNPIAASLTSTGATITISTGPGTINLEASGGGAVTETGPSAWLPELNDLSAPTSSLAGVSYTARTGTYYRINNMVYIDWYVAFSTVTSFSAALGLGYNDTVSIKPLSNLTGLANISTTATNNAGVTITECTSWQDAGLTTRNEFDWRRVVQGGRISQSTGGYISFYTIQDPDGTDPKSSPEQTMFNPTSNWFDGSDFAPTYYVLAGSMTLCLT